MMYLLLILKRLRLQGVLQGTLFQINGKCIFFLTHFLFLESISISTTLI